MTRGEFIIPTTCGFATRGRNYTIPTPPPKGIEAFILQKESSAKLNESLQAYLVYKDLEFLPPNFCCPAKQKLRKESISINIGQK